MDFNINDVAVYPGKGVGRISAIEKRSVPGLSGEIEVYILDFPSNAKNESDISSRLEVPVKNASRQKMRAIMSLDRIEVICNILRIRGLEPSTQTWNRRYRDYITKIATGEPAEIAEVLRDLALLKVKKNLSFGERKMYDQALSLIIEEWSHALQVHSSDHKDLDLNIVREEIKAEIDEIFRPDAEAAAKLQEAKVKKKKGSRTRSTTKSTQDSQESQSKEEPKEG
ncbi:MAG: CarD family transcriptional regulator [Myxococcota bacterium]|nr:CarD family transcriptional regulator [Myxococcota bacterium]